MTDTAAAVVPSPDAGSPDAGSPEVGRPPEPTPPATAPQEQPPEHASTDPEDAPIPPDSLRVDERVGEELFGANYTANTSYGPSAYGNYNTVNHNTLAPPPPKATLRQLTHVPQLMKCYVESDVDRRLDQVLTDQATPVACLTGPRNSGRFSTVCAALARRFAPDRVYEIALPAGGTPYSLTEQRKEIGRASCRERVSDTV